MRCKEFTDDNDEAQFQAKATDCLEHEKQLSLMLMHARQEQQQHKLCMADKEKKHMKLQAQSANLKSTVEGEDEWCRSSFSNLWTYLKQKFYSVQN